MEGNSKNIDEEYKRTVFLESNFAPIAKYESKTNLNASSIIQAIIDLRKEELKID